MTTQGKRLKKIRQALNLSGEEFGVKIGVSKQYVSNLEADRNILNNEKLVSLLLDFNVNINYLLCGVGDMFIPAQFEQVQDDLVLRVREILRSEGVIK